MKCIKCGKNAEVSNLCGGCFLDGYSNLKKINRFSLNICLGCGSYSWKDRFYPSVEFNESLEKAVVSNIVFDKKPDSIKLDIKMPEHLPKHGSKVNICVLLTIKTSIGSLVKEERKTLPVVVKYTVCPKCSKQFTRYFEGVIQLRNNKNASFENAADYIRKRIEARKGVFITAEEELGSGIDFYVTSQKYIQTLGYELYKRFGGELKITSSLHTKDKQTSRDVYRVNVLLRLPEFNIGDVLRISYGSGKKKLICVGNVSGSKVSGVDLEEGKKISGLYKEYEVLATKADYKEAIITKSKPHIEVLHPETYDSVRLENPKNVKDKQEKVHEKEKEHKIDVVVIDRKVYAV